MNKRYIKTITIIMMIVAMFMLTACPSNESGSSSDGESRADVSEKALAVAVVTGWRTGNNEISVNAEEISDAVYESCYSFGSVSFARVDGNPEQYIKYNIPEPTVNGLSKAKLDSIAERYKNEIFEEFMRCGAAKYPEADTIEAIRMEAATLRGAGNDADKYMVIIDSGLSTTGYLDFSKGLLDANTEDIVSELERKQAIPDLTDIKMKWLYCGETAEPQQQLSEAQKNKIKEIYTAIFEAGNAKDIVFSDEIPTSIPYTDLPEVSVINAEKREIDVPIMKTIVLDSSKVSFVGDEATFINPMEAKKAIQEVAFTLKEYPENIVYVAGSTAGMDGNSAWSQELSEMRANAVVGVLKAEGISAERLIPLGLGSNAPWHIPDTDVNGDMIEENAQLNRCVYVIDVNDPKYGNILETY